MIELWWKSKRKFKGLLQRNQMCWLEMLFVKCQLPYETELSDLKIFRPFFFYFFIVYFKWFYFSQSQYIFLKKRLCATKKVLFFLLFSFSHVCVPYHNRKYPFLIRKPINSKTKDCLELAIKGCKFLPNE